METSRCSSDRTRYRRQRQYLRADTGTQWRCLWIQLLQRVLQEHTDVQRTTSLHFSCSFWAVAMSAAVSGFDDTCLSLVSRHANHFSLFDECAWKTGSHSSTDFCTRTHSADFSSHVVTVLGDQPAPSSYETCERRLGFDHTSRCARPLLLGLVGHKKPLCLQTQCAGWRAWSGPRSPRPVLGRRGRLNFSTRGDIEAYRDLGPCM